MTNKLHELVEVGNVFVVLVVEPELVDVSVFVFHQADAHAMLVFQVVEHAVVVLAEHVDYLGAYHESDFAELALGLGASHPAVDHAERWFPQGAG